MIRRRPGAAVGAAWLTFFCGYWAWHFAGPVGLLAVAAVWAGLIVFARRR